MQDNESIICNCSTCNKEMNIAVYSYSHCSKCKKDFCSTLDSPKCFSDHSKECKEGFPMTIFNPQWIRKLRTMDKEKK